MPRQIPPQKFHQRIECPICKLVLLKRNLRLHAKNRHSTDLIMDSKRDATRLKCIDCNKNFTYRKYLIEHLSSIHNFNFQFLEYRFNNLNEFQNWKQSIELRQSYKYKLSSTFPNGYAYSCVQLSSTHWKEECTSYIKLVKSESYVQVVHQTKHYRHDVFNKKETTKQEKMELIASKIRRMKPKFVLEKIKNSTVAELNEFFFNIPHEGIESQEMKENSQEQILSPELEFGEAFVHEEVVSTEIVDGTEFVNDYLSI